MKVQHEAKDTVHWGGPASLHRPILTKGYELPDFVEIADP